VLAAADHAGLEFEEIGIVAVEALGHEAGRAHSTLRPRAIEDAGAYLDGG
jgi:hypothetical protein